MDDTKCEICDHVQPTRAYDDWFCDGCGQHYVYNEGHAIDLSAEQLELLRMAWLESKK